MHLYYEQSKNEKSKFQLPALFLSFQVFLSNSLFVTESTSLSEKHRLNRAKLSRNLKLINRANIVNRKLTYLTDQHRNKCIIMPYHFSMRQLKAIKEWITAHVQIRRTIETDPWKENFTRRSGLWNQLHCLGGFIPNGPDRVYRHR